MSGQQPDENEIILDGFHFKLMDGLNVVNTASIGGKITIGDYSLDSNDLLSSWIISDLSGGSGVATLNVASDQGRYRISDIYTRYPKQFTLPYVVDKGATSGTATHPYYPLGDLSSAATGAKYFAAGGAGGTTLYFEEFTGGYPALTAAPVNKGVGFTGTDGIRRLYIPMGASGFAHAQTIAATMTNVAAGATAPAAQAFLVWDDKLIAIDTAGQLWYQTAGGSVFTSYGTSAKLEAGYGPKHLLAYYNRNDDPTVMVVSDSGIFAFDAAGPKLWRTEIDLPGHRRAGLGACVWRGDMYIAAGMDVVVWNGSVQRNIGLSRDNGLPLAQQGYIVDLQPTLNSIYALVMGLVSGTVGTNWTYSLHEWSGIGWHQIWTEQVAAAGTPTWMAISADVSMASGSFQTDGPPDSAALYAGLTTSGRLIHQVPLSFANPREALNDPNSLLHFGASSGATVSGGTTQSKATWTLQSGRFDAGMRGYKKIANAVEVFVAATSSSAVISVEYRIDGATSYTSLGNVTTTGSTILPFGTLTADGIYPGIAFSDIELQLTYTVTIGGSTRVTPIVESLALSFLKLRAASYSWNGVVDLSQPHRGQKPQAMIDKLDALAASSTFFAMNHRGTIYRVRLNQPGGHDNPSKDERGNRILNILQIPVSPGLT